MGWGTVLVVVLILGVAFGSYYVINGWFLNNTDTYYIEGKVKDKWTVANGDKMGCYMLRINITKECDPDHVVNGHVNWEKVLEVSTNSFYAQISDDKLYSEIKVNSTYRFRCWGCDMLYWNWGPLTLQNYWYPNVIEAALISP